MRITQNNLVARSKEELKSINLISKYISGVYKTDALDP